MPDGSPSLSGACWFDEGDEPLDWDTEYLLRWAEPGMLEPMTDEPPPENRCPRCDAYVGGLRYCPVCTADQPDGMPERKPTPPGWAQPILMAFGMLVLLPIEAVRALFRRIFQGSSR